MNRTLSLLVVTALVALSTACEKTLGGQIDDATNQRPAEKIQDKVEDIGDAIKK